MDLRLFIWWVSLCVVGLFNGLLWFFVFRSARSRFLDTDRWRTGRWHVGLSFIYVIVCAFRGILPRADVQRLVLFDTWLSNISVGRTVATLAEMACVIQWSLLLRDYGQAARLKSVHGVGTAIVGLIAFAECCSWYAVLTQNFWGNAVEESCWAILGFSVGMCLLKLHRVAHHPQKMLLPWGAAVAFMYVLFMVTVDVPMYVTRALADNSTHLSLTQGMADLQRRVVSTRWEDWAEEIAWQTLYFSAAVWVMVSLMRAPQWRSASHHR